MTWFKDRYCPKCKTHTAKANTEKCMLCDGPRIKISKDEAIVLMIGKCNPTLHSRQANGELFKMKTSVVIGANFGDEGKGLVTDFLSGGEECLVIRFNGGAQAGHTVVDPDGRRHIFKHFGSGSLKGAATYLSRHFIVNPILYRKEQEELMLKCKGLKVMVDQRCAVSTPWDMLLNQALEKSRGRYRHGSCGVGINETIHRHENMLSLHVSGLKSPNLRQNLEFIRDHYVPKRAKILGIAVPEIAMDDKILLQFMDDCYHFSETTTLMQPHGFSDWDNLVFEGAQGLHLDMDSGNFPYVTRSHTGLQNVQDVCSEAGIEEADVWYVTRTYSTKHGPGEFRTEGHSVPQRAQCLTNKENPWQGEFRMGMLDREKMVKAIWKDQNSLKYFKAKSWNLALTHCDQIDGGQVTFLDSDQKWSADLDMFFRGTCAQINAKGGLMSHGPTRDDVRLKSFDQI